MNGIIDAIAAHDGELAARASVDHVNRVKALALKALRDAASPPVFDALEKPAPARAGQRVP